MATEVSGLIEEMRTQIEALEAEFGTVETKKVSSKRARKATSELEKLGKSFRKATVAAEKK